MNDQSPLSAEQLAQATSRALPPDAALDVETVSLREGFLHLGRAVEAANSDFDEAALLSKVMGASRPAARPEKRWWPLVLTAALAASALVAIVRTVAVLPGSRNEITVTSKAPHQPAIVGSGPDAAASVSQLAWSDPLDEEIASAQDAVGLLSGRHPDLDGSLMNFGSRLEALAAELESGSL